MHEFQLLRQVARMVDDLAQAQTRGYPTIIRLQVRQDSHISEHSLKELQTTFMIAAQGTKAHTAQLEIITIPIHGHCQICMGTIKWDESLNACPTCGRTKVQWEEPPEVVLQDIDWAEEIP